MVELIVFICMALFYICLGGTFILIGLIINHSIKKKFKYVKFEIFIFIVMILSIILLKYYHMIPNSIEYSNTVSYYMVNNENGEEEQFIKLPPKSKWLFKTPTDIFTCDLNAKDCKLFFEDELKKMKTKGVIDDFDFHKDRNYFSIKKYSNEIATISIIDDGDKRRFGILYEY